MSTYDWLLALHLLAAFCFVSGGIAAGTLHWAMRRELPSEVALLQRLDLQAVGLGRWSSKAATSRCPAA